MWEELRVRIRHKPWAEDELKQHPELVIASPETWRGKWAQFFGNTNPIHLEIGSGKGQFIANIAKTYPEINFIGLELQTSVIVSALEKVKALEQTNIALLNKDARDLVHFFAPGELDRIYLNFSDPWPKRRHAKRRLTHVNFLDIYKQILKPQGEIHLKTDNQKFFEFSLNSFSDEGFRLKNITFDLHQSDFEGNIMTEYEEKFSQQGMPIYRCEAVLV